MTTPARASALSRAPGLAEVVRERHCVVLNLPRLEEQQSPYVFDGTSFAIWLLIDGTRSEAQIVDELAEAYEASRDQVAGDVEVFVTRLLELELVTLDPPNAGEDSAVS